MTEPTFDHEIFISEVKKQWGVDAIQDLKAVPRLGAPRTFIPSSSEALNRALGIGGIPVGRITEAFGNEASGKTTLALDLCAHAQQMYPKRPVVYVDSEHSLDPKYAEGIGVDLNPKRFILHQNNEAESALDFAYKAAKAGAGLIVIDSVAALESKNQMEGDDSTKTVVAGIAKPLRAAIRKLLDPVACGVTVLFLNQITLNPSGYGKAETTPGGKALGYFASLRLEVKSGGPIDLDKDTGECSGILSKVKVIKNKVAPPFRLAQYQIQFGTGIDRFTDLATVATDDGIFTKSGTWYSFGETKLGQGLSKVIDLLKSDPKLEAEVRKQVVAKAA